MFVTTVFGVREAAKRAKKMDGTVGVTVHYIRAEIDRGNLKAELVKPVVGKPYFIITEDDFQAWEERRARKGE